MPGFSEWVGAGELDTWTPRFSGQGVVLGGDRRHFLGGRMAGG